MKKLASERAKDKYTLKSNAMNIKPQLPKRLTIELNNTCNHKCIFCFAHSEFSKRKIYPQIMRRNIVEKILLEAKENGIGIEELGLHISGEPLLYNDYSKIVSYAKKLGFKYIYMTTNGALGDIARFKEIFDAGLDSIRFSINAASRELYKEIHGKDDFEKVLKNIYMVSEYKKNNKNINLSISSVYTKKTKDELTEFKKKMLHLVDEVILIPVAYLDQINDCINDEYGLNIIEKYKELTACPFLFNSLFINAEGNVITCCVENGFKESIMGSIYSGETLKEIWYNKKFQKMRQNHIDKKFQGTMCNGCEFTKKGREVFINE